MQSKQLGSLVSFHRKKAGLTQVELARHAGVSRSVIQDLEAGKGRTIWRHLEAVFSVLNIELKPSGPLVEQWLKARENTP